VNRRRRGVLRCLRRCGFEQLRLRRILPRGLGPAHGRPIARAAILRRRSIRLTRPLRVLRATVAGLRAILILRWLILCWTIATVAIRTVTIGAAAPASAATA
jgi:hypothetical protein